MTSSNPEPGEVLEDYELLERIGGNMGLVFKARHRLLDKVVVLKLVPTECIADPARLTRFQREVRVMGQLGHPNLVTAADARSVDNWHLVAMEWIDGIDLQQLVRARGPLPVAAACEVARQAAQGLQYAHEHGLIHRDIKPSNLMLTRAGILKVIDMGLALIREDSAAQLTRTGLVLGTMSYCAPEQFRDASHVDIRVDIYSLGCTLYHLLTGKPPYSERKSFAEVVEAHLHEPFPGLVEAPDAPAGLEAVLMRMTAKDRDARFSTPGEVVEALEPYAHGADLRPLVPERTPQAPTIRIKTDKMPPNFGGQRRAAGGERQPKVRWTRRSALFGLGGAIMGGTALWYFKHDPVVVLIDTTAERGIYDDDNKKVGRSNTKELYEIIQREIKEVSPANIEEYSIGLNWERRSRVILQRPDIVVVHRSVFYHPVAAALGFLYPDQIEINFTDKEQIAAETDQFDLRYKILGDDKLREFLHDVGSAEARTKFLVYSRGTDKKWLSEDYRRTWIEEVGVQYPTLKDRVEAMLVQGEGERKGTFRIRANRDELVKRVRGMLNLPEKTKPN